MPDAWNRNEIASWTIVYAANAFNILVTGVFLCRGLELRKAESVLGILCVSLILPAAGAAFVNWRHQQPGWSYRIPLVLILFLLVELLLDYVLKVDFRQSRWVWAYIALYFAAQWSLIGYAFLVGRGVGYATLVTYFVSLIGVWWAHSR